MSAPARVHVTGGRRRFLGTLASADDEATCAANMAIGEKIAALPATTLAGLRFKAEVSADQDHRDRDLIVSIMDDIAGLKEDRS